MKYVVIEDPNYTNSINDEGVAGICIDSINNLWLVPITETINDDPRIVSDVLKIKKLDNPESPYDGRRLLSLVPSGCPDIELTKDGLVYIEPEFLPIGDIVVVGASAVSISSKKSK